MFGDFSITVASNNIKLNIGNINEEIYKAYERIRERLLSWSYSYISIFVLLDDEEYNMNSSF